MYAFCGIVGLYVLWVLWLLFPGRAKPDEPKPKPPPREFETTGRGFKIYGRVLDTKKSTVTLRVQESSAVGGTCVWIFTEHSNPLYKEPEPHLDVEGARELIRILQLYVEDAQTDENWRNAPEYREVWGY